MPRTIDVVEYDPAWDAAFAGEARQLAAVFGDTLVAIHHVGSTSVPGLPAKPTIDILVVLRETGTMDRFSASMERLGYRVRGECLDAEIPGTPGRFYFSNKRRDEHSHHVPASSAD